MHRLSRMRDAFPKSTQEYSQQVERLLLLRRAEMDTAWEKVEQGWKAIDERMAVAGLRPRTNDESVIELNVGGTDVTVCWDFLAETEGFKGSTLGALLKGVWGNDRIPRDADGRIVLDESPTCVKHIIHTMRTGRANSIANKVRGSGSLSAVAIDEVPFLIYTAYTLGLWRTSPDHPRYAKLRGGSTTLNPFEVAPLGAKIREWVSGCTDRMTLLYRATRNGFDRQRDSNGNEALHAECDQYDPCVVSLFRVSSGEKNGDDSVVGGYGILPWNGGCGSAHKVSKEMFVFMLKDGSAPRKGRGKRVKWHAHRHCVDENFTEFRNDLFAKPDEASGDWILQVTRNTFNIEEDSPFLALDGKKVVDFEVYRCSAHDPDEETDEPEPDSDDVWEWDDDGDVSESDDGNVLTDAEAHDVHSFGEKIASSFTEERAVLDRAAKEMKAAGSRVCAAVGALKTMYGPSVAAGQQDTVVELNVRGTRMTTLLSTLLVCPRSALAGMFKEDRWPAADDDEDEHGRRLIDCSPTCFSKILDVLRMRKRALWSRGAAQGKQELEEEWRSGVPKDGVLYYCSDIRALCEAVSRYFPGCQGFIMDVVKPV